MEAIEMEEERVCSVHIASGEREEEERDRLHSLGRRRHVRFAQKHIGNRNIERDCKGIGIFTPTPKAQGYISKTFTFPSLFSSRFLRGITAFLFLFSSSSQFPKDLKQPPSKSPKISLPR